MRTGDGVRMRPGKDGKGMGGGPEDTLVFRRRRMKVGREIICMFFLFKVCTLF